MKQNNLKSPYKTKREAIETDDVALLKTLLDQDPNLLNSPCELFGTTLLHEAASRNACAIAELLITRGADITIEDNDGDTPFETALAMGHEAMVNLFINFCPNTVEIDLETAASFGYVSTAKLLLETSITSTPVTDDFFEKEQDFTTKDKALHIAVFYGHLAMARFLLHNGARVNSASISKETPLHIAVKCGRSDMARFLIAEGANVAAIDSHGKTPLSIAEELTGTNNYITFMSPHIRCESNGYGRYKSEIISIPHGYNVHGQDDTSKIIPIFRDAKRIRQEYQAVTLLKWIRLTDNMKQDENKETTLALLPGDMFLHMNEVLSPELTPMVRRRVCAFGIDKNTLHKEMTKQRFFSMVFQDDAELNANDNNDEAAQSNSKAI